MWNQPEHDQFAEELFLAGQRVPAGLYRQVESARTVRLDREDFLPASFDGHVACYILVRETWSHASVTTSGGGGTRRVRLAEPVGPADHRLGPENAPVTLVQYGSYDCPHCRQALGIIEEIREKSETPLQLIYRHFPDETPRSVSHRAAEAAEAAARQGKFWEMHAHLLRNQNALDDANLLAYAAELGLDVRKIAQELESGEHAAVVRRQFQNGRASGVHSTPTFFINGVRHDDFWDADTLSAAIQQTIAR